MLSVVVPVKDEPNLEAFLHRVHAAVQGLDYELLIVKGDRESGVYLYPNAGRQRVVTTYGDSLERSILNGFSHSRGDHIVVLDADGSHPPEMISEMDGLLGEYELVVGSRFLEGSVFKSSAYRRLVSWLCIAAARQAGSKLTDPMSGFFAVRRGVVERCRFKPLTWKTALEIELRAKPRVKEVPIVFAERSVGESKTSLRVGVKLLWELFREGWR